MHIPSCQAALLVNALAPHALAKSSRHPIAALGRGVSKSAAWFLRSAPGRGALPG